VEPTTGTIVVDRANGVTRSAELSRQGKVPVTPDGGSVGGPGTFAALALSVLGRRRQER
jgi:MYXO-CTERM domain-containing protein